MTPANAVAIRSRWASSAVSSRSSGSQAETSARASDAQKAVSSRQACSAATSAGSNHSPLRRSAIAQAASGPPSP